MTDFRLQALGLEKSYRGRIVVGEVTLELRQGAGSGFLWDDEGHFIEDVLFRPWKWLFEGCETNRSTGNLLNRIGFSHVEIDEFDSTAMPPPVSPSIVGVAIK